MRPYLIAIAGPSGSGKTELARRLAEILDAPILSLDCYYRDASHLTLEERTRINFDEPQSLDEELLAGQLLALSRGEGITAPIYDFTRHVRSEGVHPIPAAQFVIVEGILALHWSTVRDLCTTKVFVEVSDDICLARRMERDIRERGRSMESVLEQYATTVRPMAERYVLPTRQFADVVASGLDRIELSAQAVLQHIGQQRPMEEVRAAAEG